MDPPGARSHGVLPRERAFRLLAFDLDGTMLEPGGTLAEESALFLHELSKRGVDVVAATGRRYWSARPYLERAKLSGPCVVHNGALVADVASANPLLVHALPTETVRRLVAFLEERGFSPLLFTAAPRGPGEVLARAGAPDPTGYHAWYFRYAAGHYTAVERWEDADLEGVLRAAVHGEREPLVELLESVADASDSAPGFFRVLRGFLQRETTLPTSRVEFLSREASKWSGVRWVAEQRGIAAAEIVAVGDEANDVEMLAAAGHSLAAPGASEAARRSAREVVNGDGPRAVVAALARLFGRD